MLISAKIAASKTTSRIALLPLRLQANSVFNAGSVRHFAPRGLFGPNIPTKKPLDEEEDNEADRPKKDGVLGKTPLFGRALRNENLR